MPERPGDMDERDVDARFASIVARWDGPVPASGDGPDEGPAGSDAVVSPADGDTAEAVGTGRGTPEGRAAEVSPVADAVEPDAADPASSPTPPSPWVNPSPLDLVVPASAWRAAEPADPGTEAAAAAAEAALEDDVEHFEPPEVVLPPQEDLHFWGAVAGLVGGPLMLLYVVFARPFHSTRWFVAAVVVSLLGFALLILRQPKHRDPTSGDDGARV